MMSDEVVETVEQQNEPIFEVFEWKTDLICRFCSDGDINRLRLFVEFSQQMKSLAQYASELADRLDTETGLSPLHCAARYQQFEICLLLLSNIKFVFGVNIKDGDGRTPIHWLFRSSTINSRSQGKLNIETDFGNQIQNDELWRLEYAEKFLQSDFPIISLFARVNGDLNAQDKYLLTPLHYAVMRNNLLGVQQLITRGANFEIADRQGIRPLHLACRDGFVSIVEFLLVECRAKIDATDADGATPLHFACAKLQFDIVQMIKNREKDNFVNLLRRKTNIGTTCLHLAVQSDDFRLVEFLVNEFSSTLLDEVLNEQVDLLGTSLHIAAKFSDRTMINYLFRHGSNSSIVNDQGQTALHLASLFNRRAIVEELLQLSRTSILELKDKNGRTALSLITDADLLDVFIENDAKISTVDHRQMNSLMIAVENENLQLVKRYFSICPDRLTSIIDQVEQRNGLSLFLLAVETGSIPICSFLVRQSIVRTDKTNFQRMNCFHIAARSNHVDLIDFLCNSINGEIDATDDDGRTPLHIAAEFGHRASIEILLKHGADVLATNHLGQTAFFIAVQHGRRETAELLIDGSTKFSSRRQSPLNVACENGHVDLVRFLLSKQIGIFDDDQDEEQRNPLEIAIENRQKETVDVLLETSHAEFWLKTSRKTAKRKHQTPLREMIESIPDCAKHAFDRMIDANAERTTFRYDFLDDHLTKNSRELYENHPLIIALDKKQHSLVEHPLAQKLMLRKWKIYRPVYYFPRILTFLLLLFLTIYAVIAPAPQLEITSSSSFLTKLFEQTAIPMCSTIIFLSAMNFFKILTEIFLFRAFRLPFAQIFGLFSYFLAIVAFIPGENNRIIPRQWQMNSFAIVVQWFNVAVILRSTPSLGRYLVMLESIFLIFTRIFLVTSPLFIAFTISTHMLLFNQPSFSNILAAFHKTLAMLVGELDYQTLFFTKPTLLAATLIYFPFLFIMTVVFMNFLLGMTVGTVDHSSREVRVKANSYWIREIIFIESILSHRNFIDSETIKNNVENENEKNDQNPHVIELTKLVQILEMFCQQSKQMLEFENQLEFSLRSLLDQIK